MHLDGARLFNAATANAARNGTDVYEEARALCRHFDSASLCLSKGLGAPVGSLVLGSRDFIRQARRTRKILGGGMRQAGVLAAAGHHALQHHVRRLAEDHANLDRLAQGLESRVAAGKLTAAERDATLSRLSMIDGLDGLAPCGLVIEAIVEKLEAKRQLFAALEHILSRDAILATNTSSLPVGAIAAGLQHPDRLLALRSALTEIIAPAPAAAAK